jgi:hypothetical protein
MGDLNTSTDTGFSVTSEPVSVTPDEDWISSEEQRRLGIGPDFDPDYFKKLDALIEASFGPLGEFQEINPSLAAASSS